MHAVTNSPGAPAMARAMIQGYKKLLTQQINM